MHSSDMPNDIKTIVKASNEFALTFFKRTLQRDARQSNKLISPLSIYFALSMLYNGAGGTTKEAIATALGPSSTSIDQLNKACKELLRFLPAQDTAVRLSIANSIWYSETWPSPSQSFLHVSKADYNGLVEPLNFSDPSSAKAINRWVAGHTNDKITSIVDKTYPDDLLYLVNTVYFNASWLHPFESYNTADADFYLSDGRSVQVSFMRQTGTFAIWQGPSFTVVEMPYGTGQAYSMCLVLPADQHQPISEFVNKFDQVQLEKALAAAKNERIGLVLPGWDYAYAIDDMQPQLTELGMGSIFLNSDLTGMYPPDLPTELSKFVHKTNIRVGESGTEASAATVIGMRAGSAPMAAPPVIRFNRPFLYFIIEKTSSVVVFMGIINDPK